MAYRDEITVRQGLVEYFRASGFGEVSYDQKWVVVRVARIPFAFPNLEARRRAVRFHDIHHILNDFPVTLEGEARIAAWELASGCGTHWAAWVLNLLALFIGLFICPRAVFAEFARGRHCGNLYSWDYDEHLLSSTVGELRDRLGIRGAIVGSLHAQEGAESQTGTKKNPRAAEPGGL